MSSIRRRDVLFLISAVGMASAMAGPASASPGVDQDGAVMIGRAYLAQNQDIDHQSLRAELAPARWSPDALAALRDRVSSDFRSGRLFIHRGWRMSDTEGRLFALAAISHT